MNSNFEIMLLEYRWIPAMKTWHSSKGKSVLQLSVYKSLR